MTPARWIRREAPVLGCILLALLGALLCWNQAPDIVPIHWNAVGEADDYGPRALGLLAVPGLLLGLNLLLWLLPLIDPKGNIDKIRPTIGRIQLIFNLFMLLIHAAMLAAILGYAVPMKYVVPIGVLLLLLLLGNYFGKLRPNYFVGIRTPWTLEIEDNWMQTHRLAGRLWVGLSLLMIVLRFVLADGVFYVVFLVYVGVLVLVPLGYSFYRYRQGRTR
ncbi:MAG: SdpI family protein [Bacteroidia bacterium]